MKTILIHGREFNLEPMPNGGSALTEFLFWLWLAVMFAGSGWIAMRILFGLPIG